MQRKIIQGIRILTNIQLIKKQEGRTEKQKKKWDKLKTNSKMVNLNPMISNTNGLTFQLKRRDCQTDWNEDPTIYI